MSFDSATFLAGAAMGITTAAGLVADIQTDVDIDLRSRVFGIVTLGCFAPLSLAHLQRPGCLPGRGPA